MPSKKQQMAAENVLTFVRDHQQYLNSELRNKAQEKIAAQGNRPTNPTYSKLQYYFKSSKAPAVKKSEDYVRRGVKAIYDHLQDYQKPDLNYNHILHLEKALSGNQDIRNKFTHNLPSGLIRNLPGIKESGAFNPEADVATKQAVNNWYNTKTQTSTDLSQLIYLTRYKKAELGTFRFFHSPFATLRNHFVQEQALSLRKKQHEKRNLANGTKAPEWIATISKYLDYAETLMTQKKIGGFTNDAQNAFNDLTIYTSHLTANPRIDAQEQTKMNKMIDKLMDCLTKDFHFGHTEQEEIESTLRLS